LLNGKTTQTNETLVVFDEYGPVRMIRSRDWKYVHRYPYGLHELFNLSEDPGETRNRCADPACRTILRDLKGEMDEWFLRYADPAVDGAKEPVTGCGQKYWAGVRGQGNPSYMPVPPSLPIHPPTYNTFE
jgi:hypothetical protein